MHLIQLLTDMTKISFHTVEAFTMEEHKRVLIHTNTCANADTHAQTAIYLLKKKPNKKQ